MRLDHKEAAWKLQRSYNQVTTSHATYLQAHCRKVITIVCE